MDCCGGETKKEITGDPVGGIKLGDGGKKYLFPLAILISTIVIAGAWIYITGLRASQQNGVGTSRPSQASLKDMILSSDAVTLPLEWGDLGIQLVNAGVIDEQKLKAIYFQRGGLTEKDWNLIDGSDNKNLVFTSANSGFILNLLWALGLSNKNDILENGPMSDPRYGGAGTFASTGGWSLAKGEAMDYYSKFNFINLSAEQQALVEKVSKGIYRPCCDNSTYFPDCNHGMAMLGLLELMASQGKSEEEMYRMALIVNSFWFPDNYQNIAKFMENKGVQWKDVNPQEVLGANFSSSSGYRRVLSQVQPVQGGGGNSCGI